MLKESETKAVENIRKCNRGSFLPITSVSVVLELNFSRASQREVHIRIQIAQLIVQCVYL